jgi:phage-related minor tail protein
MDVSNILGGVGNLNNPRHSYHQKYQFRQYGGPVGMGNPYVVGERGAELFTPLTAGTITPSNELATGQGNMSILAKLDQLNATMAQVAGNTGNTAQTDALHNQISTLRQLLSEAKRTYRVSRDLRNNTV